LEEFRLRRKQSLKGRAHEFAGVPGMIRTELGIADARAGHRHDTDDDEQAGDQANPSHRRDPDVPGYDFEVPSWMPT
jgi:hypothetical protein